MKSLISSTFSIVANGFADGPAQALRDFFLERGVRFVFTVFHPLVPEGDARHQIALYEGDGKVTRRYVSLPFRPPLTYPLDLLVPFKVPVVDAWFGFTNLAVARGLFERAMHRTEKVFYWCVDFVPERFGKSIATVTYDAVDRFVCQHADARVELSQAALEGRNERHGIPENKRAPSFVIPMGAWLDRVPTIDAQAWKKKKIVYLGHLVERQGVAELIEAVRILAEKGIDMKLEVVGGGPLEGGLRARVHQANIAHLVKFHGFIDDHRKVESVLADGSIGAAPYKEDPASFTQFADPGKLKVYLAAGLPILLTRVPPNADELAARGGAYIARSDPESLADGILELLKDPADWQRRHKDATALARRYDWRTIFEEGLARLGFR